MSGSLAKLLLLRSEGGSDAVLWGQEAAPHFGRTFDRLLAAGILVERAPATGWSVCRRCDGTCGAREIVEIDERLVAECSHYPTESLPLAPHEVRSFSIDVGALIADLARASGLVGAHEQVSDEIWLLGQGPGERSVFLVTNVLALAAPSGLTLVAARAEPSQATLIVPDMAPASVLRTYRDAACHIVTFEQALAEDGIRLNVGALVPSQIRRARLVFDRAASVFILDGRKLTMTDQAARLLAALTEAACQHAGFLSREEVEASVYGRLSPPEARPLRDVVRDLRDQMSAGLAEADAHSVRRLIENKRVERYRLALPANDITIVG